MTDVFLSYATPDREHVARLARALADAGLNVWWDRALVPGDQYENVIDRALGAAKAVVVCWSPDAVASDWVRSEAEDARNRRTLCPVVLVPVDRLPKPFDQIHTGDLSAWKGGSHPDLDELIEALRARVEGRAPTPIAYTARPRARGRSFAATLSSFALLVALGGAGFAAWRFDLIDQLMPAAAVAAVDGCDSGTIASAVIAGTLTVDDAERLGAFCARDRFAAGDVGDGADADSDAQRDYAENFAAAATSADPREREAAALELEGRSAEAYALFAELAEEAETDNAEADAAQLWRRAGALAFPGDTGAALDAFERARALEPDHPATLVRLARLHHRRGDLDTALTLYDEAEDEADRIEIVRRRGNVHLSRSALDDAKAAYEEALDGAVSLGLRSAEADALNNLGLVELRSTNTTDSQKYFERALSINQDLGDQEGIAMQLGNLGVVAIAGRRFAEAEDYLEEAFDISQSLGDTEAAARALANLAMVATESGRLDAADDYAQRSLVLNQEIGSAEGTAISYLNIARIADARGDVARSCDAWRSAHEAFSALGAVMQTNFVEQEMRVLDCASEDDGGVGGGAALVQD